MPGHSLASNGVRPHFRTNVRFVLSFARGPMHIPDGYLSPSTCAGLYAAAAPFWYGSLRVLKNTLHTRMVPLLSVFAAFAFVVMMFNLPLPGGTTGHAVGMAVAAIVLGPWASILAVSIALIVQAAFFGDGGITAIGANCFNIAVAGSFAAYGVYRAAAFRASIGSARRVLAAGIAGYLAINVSALLAAIEFGIQPILFHDAAGAPLYAPYPLPVAVPAMMIGHLTIAGLAEFVISAGVIAWLQRTDPILLRRTAPGAPDRAESADAAAIVWPSARKLWLYVALLLILTPLGLVAVGSAWGEWAPQDYKDAQARLRIARASADQALPAQVPAGLDRLSRFWTAPLSGYAPSFIRSAPFGYFVSAAMGVGIVILAGLVLKRVFPDRDTQPHPGRRRRKSFIEKTTAGLAAALEHAFFAEDFANSPGFLQGLDARVKLAGIASLIAAAVAVNRLSILAGIFGCAVALGLGSGVTLRAMSARVWIVVLAFSGAIALPALFLTPGGAIWHLPGLGWPITWQGLRGAGFLILRAETTATLSVLPVLTTRWPRLLHALRFFRVPAVFIALLGMTYRYIFLLLETARQISESREARQVGHLAPADRRRLAAAGAGVLLSKSLLLSAEVHVAMQARGFRGEVYLLDDPRMNWREWLPFAISATIAGIAIWFGR